MISKVLFLDDMVERHKSFISKLGMDESVQIYQAWSAAEAIRLLQLHHFDQVFLDHDLSIDDIMCEPGSSSGKEPTGMAVVDHIMKMDEPPPDIVIHSCNEPAAMAMLLKLDQHPTGHSKPLGLKVRKIPFPYLLQMI